MVVVCLLVVAFLQVEVKFSCCSVSPGEVVNSVHDCFYLREIRTYLGGCIQVEFPWELSTDWKLELTCCGGIPSRVSKSIKGVCNFSRCVRLNISSYSKFVTLQSSSRKREPRGTFGRDLNKFVSICRGNVQVELSRVNGLVVCHLAIVFPKEVISQSLPEVF